jgi:hypothetical protein
MTAVSGPCASKLTEVIVAGRWPKAKVGNRYPPNWETRPNPSKAHHVRALGTCKDVRKTRLIRKIAMVSGEDRQAGMPACRWFRELSLPRVNRQQNKRLRQVRSCLPSQISCDAPGLPRRLPSCRPVPESGQAGMGNQGDAEKQARSEGLQRSERCSRGG